MLDDDEGLAFRDCFTVGAEENVEVCVGDVEYQGICGESVTVNYDEYLFWNENIDRETLRSE